MQGIEEPFQEEGGGPAPMPSHYRGRPVKPFQPRGPSLWRYPVPGMDAPGIVRPPREAPWRRIINPVGPWQGQTAGTASWPKKTKGRSGLAIRKRSNKKR